METPLELLQSAAVTASAVFGGGYVVSMVTLKCANPESFEAKLVSPTDTLQLEAIRSVSQNPDSKPVYDLVMHLEKAGVRELQSGVSEQDFTQMVKSRNLSEWNMCQNKDTCKFTAEKLRIGRTWTEGVLKSLF